MESTVDNYIKIAKTSRTSPNYKKSNVFKLEQLLLNRKEYVKHSVKFKPLSVNTRKSFVALVAPSLTGKTQAAFTIDKIRPLYFALDYSNVSKQNIYKKFDELNFAIKEAAEEDYRTILTKFKEPKGAMTEEDYILKNISSDNLENNFLEVKMFTLGLLIKLIEDSELGEEKLENGTEWMRFHSERDRFSYTALSINDITEKGPIFLEMIKTKYYLFLDEFVAEGYWAVLVRNLARCIEMAVVVANTNSDISNLIGKVHVGGSRSDENDLWSFVIIKLDTTDWEFLNSFCALENGNDLTNKIKTIIESSSDHKAGSNFKIEKLFKKKIMANPSKFVHFFHELINNVIPKLRPGMA